MVFTRYILLASFLGFSIQASAVTDEQMRRITADPIVTSTLTAIQTKYKVTCKLPTEDQMKWTCLGNSACLYRMPVSCAPADDKTPGKYLEVLVTGFDNAQSNELRSIVFTKKSQ